MVAASEGLARAVDAFASSHPDSLAVVTDERSWSWRELRDLARAYAAQLEGAASRTDVVFLPAGGEAVALLAAYETAGLRAILVAPPYNDARALAVRDQLGARRVVTARDAELRVLAGAGDAGTPDATALRVAAIGVLTSGTTGAPKCALHTWATLGAAVKQRDTFAERRWLIAYPLSHFAALQVLAQCIFNRGTLVIPRDFGAQAGLVALRNQRVHYLCGTPTYVRQVLLGSSPADWEAMSLVHVTMGGEIVDQAVIDGLRARRPNLEITHTYASTELGAVLSVKDGRAGFDIALADGKDLEIRDGELFVRRSSRAMLGYVGDASAPDAWVATGDQVEVVGDRVLFRGRTTDVINVGGFKVSPLTVEAVIRGVAGVRDVLVVGRKSSITGHLLKAVVCADHEVDRTALQAAIAQRCTEQLPPYMVPRLFEFRDELERATSQKLARV